jgi:hypothetical protein
MASTRAPRRSLLTQEAVLQRIRSRQAARGVHLQAPAQQVPCVLRSAHSPSPLSETNPSRLLHLRYTSAGAGAVSLEWVLERWLSLRVALRCLVVLASTAPFSPSL